MTDKPIKSLAGHVLATGEATPEESARLAAYALQDDPPPITTKSKEELQRLLRKLEGVEGQEERRRAIKAQIERMG